MSNDKVNEAAADKAKPRCSTCGKYTDKKTSPQCYGHGSGGGGGGGSSGESASKDDSKGLDLNPTKMVDAVLQSSNVMTDHIPDTDLQPQLDVKAFNSEVISDLLEKQLLLIDNDREQGTLAIKLLCDPKHLTHEQRLEFNKFVKTILKELDEFKKENGISNECKLLEQDKEGNILSLRIILPTPTLYDSFIQRLASKELLPKQNIEQRPKEKVTYSEGINHFTPFSTKPTPSANKNAENEEVHQIGKHGTPQEKSSIRPKSPLDGFKPNGWK